MLELTLLKPNPDVRARAAAGRPPGRLLTGWLLRMWRAAARHAERPGRFVPYY
ncbi:MAG: hypothetical protein ACXW2G_15385 [Burkholderiaceae bacterium]